MTGAASAGTVITPALLRSWPLPVTGEDKDSRGRGLVIGGSVANPGAALLAARAAMRAGAGKIQLVVPDPVAVALAVAVPESAVHGAPCTSEGNLDASAVPVVQKLAGHVDAVLVGPGMLSPDSATAAMAAIAPDLQGTVVLDALALAWLTQDPTRGQHFDSLVLTPNIAELGFTLGEDPQAVEENVANAVLRLAELAGAVVSAGSKNTWIGTPDGRLWRSDEGNAGLGVSGSGDVQAGILLGLCARGVEPAQAAVWAAYLHGTIGSRLASQYGPTGYLASELTMQVPYALREIGTG